MTQWTGGGDPTPGDVRPAVRELDRPPGERYEAPRAEAPPAGPDLARATVLGMVAALLTAVAWGVLLAILDLDLGLIAVAVIGGWAVGQAVAWGAWRSADHAAARGVQGLAAVLGTLCWLGGSAIAYVISLAILPGSALPFGERMAVQPLAEWLSPQLTVLDPIEIAILAFVAWNSAR